MAAKSGRLGTWLKMLAVGGAVCVGGPALVLWVQPTDEELFKKYNPELQKKSLERRYEKQKDFDDFVTQLKEYSKSDKPSMCLSLIPTPDPFDPEGSLNPITRAYDVVWIGWKDSIFMRTLANIMVVWVVQEEAARKRKEEMLRKDFLSAEEAKARKEAMRKESGLSSNSDS
ncbi:CBP4-domain-containing protein [Hypomontagnella submonticulosa]|nr:CBP4-domain-containing protein [Hypomontagnella submonticulosa]